MQAIILAATHEKAMDFNHKEIPLILVDILGKPQLTFLVEKLSEVPNLNKINIITNEAIKPDLEKWASTVPPQNVEFEIIGDETYTKEDRLGAIGDIIFLLKKLHISDDLIIVGGDNWFRYDISEFVEQARYNSPAVVVTPYDPKRFQVSQFGLVKMKGNRIQKFIEKPKKSSLNLKASCVYFFSKTDLSLFDRFSKQEEKNIQKYTPGSFLAWLIDKKVAVYGIKLKAGWLEINKGDRSNYPGQDWLLLRDIIRRKYDTRYLTWEKRAIQISELANSYLDLLFFLEEKDPNLRIIVSIILGILIDNKEVITKQSRKHIKLALIKLLNDGRENVIDGSYQADEDEAWFVSATAAETLVKLGLAKSVSDVYKKARKEGFAVVETTNKTLYSKK